MKYTVMIPAAGSGTRMGAGFNKLLLLLKDKPIIIHTLLVFERDESCEAIFLAVKEEERAQFVELLTQYGITKVTRIVTGGSERQQSVMACLEAYEGNGIVLVHDAARPFLRRSVIHELLVTVQEHGAAIAGVRAKDTMKFAPDGIIEETVDREKLWIIQTPQAFHYDVLYEAAKLAEESGFLGTDESMLVERMGGEVRVVESTYDNVKMTTQDDLALGEVLLQRNALEGDA